MRTLELNSEAPSGKTSKNKKALSKGDAQFGYLILTMIGTGILSAVHADISLFIIAILFGYAIAFWNDLAGNFNSQRFLMRLVVVGALTGFFLVNFGGTAHATEIAELIFNVIRAAVVIYLAISGVQIFMAIKRQEGFFEAAQLPLASLLIISVVDIIAGFVVT